ncbi:MAG: hypothetical protein ACKVKR_04175, partial [Pseudomonadales bacterium]
LQQELQMERLEKLINGDKKDNQVNVQVKKARDDLLKVQAELKELKKLDPLRLKRQVTDLKKKNIVLIGCSDDGTELNKLENHTDTLLSHRHGY